MNDATYNCPARPASQPCIPYKTHRGAKTATCSRCGITQSLPQWHREEVDIRG